MHGAPGDIRAEPEHESVLSSSLPIVSARRRRPSSARCRRTLRSALSASHSKASATISSTSSSCRYSARRDRAPANAGEVIPDCHRGCVVRLFCDS